MTTLWSLLHIPLDGRPSHTQMSYLLSSTPAPHAISPLKPLTSKLCKPSPTTLSKVLAGLQFMWLVLVISIYVLWAATNSSCRTYYSFPNHVSASSRSLCSIKAGTIQHTLTLMGAGWRIEATLSLFVVPFLTANVSTRYPWRIHLFNITNHPSCPIWLYPPLKSSLILKPGIVVSVTATSDWSSIWQRRMYLVVCRSICHSILWSVTTALLVNSCVHQFQRHGRGIKQKKGWAGYMWT